LILVRKPFDVGDRIAISDPQEDTDANGSAGWIVEKVDLFTTTMRFATTREVATISNGALAGSRIINLKRSEKALVYIYLKFGVDVPHGKIESFKEEVTAFVKDRPREWLALTGFRSTRIEADLGENCLGGGWG
jgi:small-conductance mechanosensitive channel